MHGCYGYTNIPSTRGDVHPRPVSEHMRCVLKLVLSGKKHWMLGFFFGSFTMLNTNECRTAWTNIPFLNFVFFQGNNVRACLKFGQIPVGWISSWGIEYVPMTKVYIYICFPTCFFHLMETHRIRKYLQETNPSRYSTSTRRWAVQFWMPAPSTFFWLSIDQQNGHGSTTWDLRY